MTDQTTTSQQPADEREAARISALKSYQLLDTPPDGTFDRITALAASLFQVPISIISLVDTDRIWFMSSHGLDATETSRDPGLCASAILNDGPWLVNNAITDPRAMANPLVAGEMGLRFYLGVPLRTSEGYNLGTLCVIDKEPREVEQEQIDQLDNLAALVMDQMELRLTARRAVSEMSGVIEEKDSALRRSALMTKEIDHRVKNSLQLVSSLLMLQSRAQGQTEAASQLSHAANRVAAVARVHQHIYLSESDGLTDCNSYLRRLTDDLSKILGMEGESRIDIDCREHQIPSSRIVPIGLIINELITNGAKHGAGTIRVWFGRTNSGKFELVVADDGNGFPDGFEPRKASGLGMKVVTALAQQLDGDVIFGRDEETGGARVAVEFADADLPQPN